MPKLISGEGPSSAKLVILGEAPGEMEDMHGRPFIGPSGNLLNSMLASAGIQRSECYVTNVCKYQPPGNDLKALHMIGIRLEDEVEHLIQELNAIKPNCILALGNTPLSVLTGKTGIKKWRGSLLQGHGFKIIPTLHPAGLLHQAGTGVAAYYEKVVIEADMRRAIKESETSKFEPPRRTLMVCRDSRELYNFLRLHEDKKYLSIDIEAERCIPSCVGLSFTPSSAMSVPLWISKNETDRAETWLLLSQILANPRFKKVGQNFKFDADKLLRMRLPIDKLYADTMLQCHTLNPEFPRSLAFNTSIYTREPYYKDEGKLFNPKKDSLDQLFIYNAKDAAVTLEIFLEVLPQLEEVGCRDFFFNFVMPLHDMYYRMEQVGFHIDEKVRRKLIDKYVRWAMRVDYELYKLAGEQVNVNSPKQVSELLYDKFKCPKRRKRSTGNLVSDEKALSGLLAGPVKDPLRRGIIERILLGRRLKKTISGPLTARADYDGRMKTSVFIVGTETGRTSNNLLSPPVRPENIGLAFQTITKHGDVGGDVREMLLPAPGKVLVNGDFGQAEARVVALLSEDYDTLRQLDEIDIHSYTASLVFGGTWQSHSKANNGGRETVERFIGKTGRHAGNLDIQKGEFSRMVTADSRKAGIEIGLFSQYKAGKFLEKFHAHCPNIRGVFHKIIQEELERTRVLISPHGRRRMFFNRWGRELFKEAYAFIPQATISDQTKTTMLKMEKLWPGLEIIAESHDSFCVQVEENLVDEYVGVLRQEMGRPITFDKCTFDRPDLIIPCDVEVGHDYKNLEPYDGRA